MTGRRALIVPVAVVAIVGVAVGVSAVRLSGHVASGVSSAGVDLGGLSRASATDVLARELDRRLDVPIRVRVNGRSAEVVPSALGIHVDAAATVRRAMRMGRLRSTLVPFGYHAVVAPVLLLPKSFDLPASLQAAVTRPVDAGLTLAPNGDAVVQPGKAGRAFATVPTLDAIALASIAGRADVRVVRLVRQPDITTGAAQKARARVARLLSGPITVTRKGGGGPLAPSQLAPLLTTKAYAHTIGVSFDPARVRTFLTAQVTGALKQPKNASFVADSDDDDANVTVVTSHSGISLNAELTARHMTTAGLHLAGGRTARIAFRLTHADFTTKQARALGVSKVVSVATTGMGVSSPNRIVNVHLMADILNGYQIAPGARFSFNEAVGPRTADRGFLEGQAIENGLLVPSIGGGVCQVATTIFDAAANGGYEINTRQNHSFYIDHYPEGMDATVADGGPDFAFTNDTGHTIVVQTSYTDSTLTVALLSAPTGRTTTLAPGAEANYTKPGKRYVSDPDVPKGQFSQQTDGERGFDFEVARTVTAADGTVVHTDTFRSHYVAEDIVFDVNPATKLPKGATLEAAPVPSDT
ncbi:MAG TPA: VanW family protein [Polyangia bacterium]|nr:VanW family protein [Polyangia bacterium]